MNQNCHRSFITFAAASLLSVSALSYGQDTTADHQHKQPAAANPSGDTGTHQPGMHMHKSGITHETKDADASAQFKGEAASLRAQAESHRKLAKLYAGRTANKGQANYATVAKHCEKLADQYEAAAKAAETAAAELAK